MAESASPQLDSAALQAAPYPAPLSPPCALRNARRFPFARVLSGNAAQKWAVSTYSRYGWPFLSFVRRDFLGSSRFTPGVPLKEDILFFLDLSSRVSRIAFGRYPGYFYTIRDGSAIHNNRDSTSRRIIFLSRLRRFGAKMRGAASRCAVWDLVQWIAERESLATAGRPMPTESEHSMLDTWRTLVNEGAVDLGSIYPYWRPGIHRWLKSGDISLLVATRKLRMLFGNSPSDPFSANARHDRSLAIDCIKAVAAILVICCHVFDSRTASGAGGPLMPALWRLCYLTSVPLFAAVCGWLSHPQDLVTYYAKKFIRILVPFFVFSALKILYSVAISSSYAHADNLSGMLFDAFILGRLYWFAYAIFLILAVAPIFWRLPTTWLTLVFLASCAISLYHSALPGFIQLQAAASLLPAFMVGMIAKRLASPKISQRASSIPSPSSAPPRPSSFFAFIGRNAWAIMFLDPFFKASLVAIMPDAALTPVVIILDLLLCASACWLLSFLPMHQLLGVSR